MLRTKHVADLDRIIIATFQNLEKKKKYERKKKGNIAIIKV